MDNPFVQHCLICQNKTEKNNVHLLLCHGCQHLLQKPHHQCYRCGDQLKSTVEKLCGSCQTSPPAFSNTNYACTYQHPMDQWIMAYKFGKKLILSRLFADLLTPILEKIPEHYVLMSVPLHRSRLRSRGYNQAYEIAKELQKITQRTLYPALIRNKNTAMQAQLSLKQRKTNVSNAFSLKKALKHKHIILIDDVMTTGNTLNECAKVLIKNGALDVKVIVVARKFMS